MASITFDGFRKRDGVIVPFCIEKITDAVSRAAAAVARQDGSSVDPSIAPRTTQLVLERLDDPSNAYYVHPDEEGRRIPEIEDVQDLVEMVLAEEGHGIIMAAYKRYRKRRQLARDRIQVRDRATGGIDVTDQSMLLVESISQDVTLPWDRSRIVKQLREKTDLSDEAVVEVAKEVENKLIKGQMGTINTSLIRELVNNVLDDHGHGDRLRDLSLYRVPRDYVEQLMYTKSEENSNIVSNNPEAVNLGLAELMLKQWALDTIFSADVKRSHDTGAVHLHDLGYPHRVYCSSHSIEYIKKYGLRDLSNLNTESNPARSASVLTGHLNTFLASMQANYAGALGIAYINIFYAPYLEGMSRREMKQVAQELVFNGSQNAFSRGGQTLFLDFNIHTGIPSYLKKVPAVGPGGQYMLRLPDGTKVELEEQLRDDQDSGGNAFMNLYYMEDDGSDRLVLREVPGPKGEGMVYDSKVQAELEDRGESIVTYGDYMEEARQFTSCLLEVWGDGDRNGRIFEFPKCDFHVSDETFEDPAQYSIFLEACDLASMNGSTYFIFDRDEVTLSACCRLRTVVDDNRMLQHPESMRFCGFQNVTINIPQAAYRAAAADGSVSYEDLCSEIDTAMGIAVQAHLQKRRRIREMMKGPGHPLYQIGRRACDGKPYVSLADATYIIGLIGVNDAVKFMTGEEMHESEEAMDLALRVVAHMYLTAKKFSEKHQLKFTLEESPAESAARRLAKTDLVYFEDEARGIVKGDDDDVVYYTNSVHLAAEAPVSMTQRIISQGQFHNLIESGAITHAFVGEEEPSTQAIAKLVEETFFRTQSAQLTISPEFTYCDKCANVSRGLLEKCPSCGSEEVVGETRVVGYFSKIANWNKSKRYGELVARHKGMYSVETASSSAVESVPDEQLAQTVIA